MFLQLTPKIKQSQMFAFRCFSGSKKKLLMAILILNIKSWRYNLKKKKMTAYVKCRTNVSSICAQESQNKLLELTLLCQKPL